MRLAFSWYVSDIALEAGNKEIRVYADILPSGTQLFVYQEIVSGDNDWSRFKTVSQTHVICNRKFYIKKNFAKTENNIKFKISHHKP
jgi:hypothetical protein